MRHKIGLFLLALFCLASRSLLHAQDGGEMSVLSFYLAETDLDANTAGTMMYDQNGEVCAIIKLETSLDGFAFDVGSLGVRDVRRVGGELWIYVPFGIRRITLSHPQLGVIRDYLFPVRIEKARTYIMKLNTRLGNRVYDNDHRQRFILQVTPADASVTINGMAVQLDSSGRFSQELAFGLYDISIQHKDYHGVTFQQQVENPDVAHFKEVVMKQDYGWLHIPEYRGETLWLNDERVLYDKGEVMKIKSGHYRVSRKLPLYRIHETDVEIKDSVVLVLDTPEYELNARTVTVSVPDDADIYLDTTRLGSGSWQGLIEYGRHTFYSKKRGCRPGEVVVDISEHGPETVSLPAPTAAFGTLSVTVEPGPAEVYSDDRYIGQAPDLFALPIGKQTISVRRSGMDTENFDIDIPDGETISLDVHLITTLTVTLEGPAEGAEVSIDGTFAGRTPFTIKIPAGVHRIAAVHNQFRDFNKDIHFNNPGKVMIPMKPRFSHKGAFYVDLQASFPGSFYAGGALGFYARNFNGEALVQYGTSGTEPIYWNAADASSEPSVYIYKPLIAGGRLGLEIPFPMGLSLTPRIGVNMVYAMGAAQGAAAFDASLASAMSAVVDLRFTARIAGPVHFKFQPEYGIQVWQSSLYEGLSEVSPSMKSWTDGFRASLGFSFIF